MWRFWILLCTAFLAESQRMDYLQMLFGEKLSIKLLTLETLEFTSVDESEKYSIWAFNWFGKRGSVTGSKSNRRFVIKHVNFEDQGTYVRRTMFKKIDYIAKVKVLPKSTSWGCVRGDTCSISLNGIEKEKASLRFSNENVTLMLVDRGSPVKNLSDYIDRIKMTSSSIQVLNFNFSDDGNYSLYDGQNRKAVTTRVFLTEPYDVIDASPLFSLLLLLGIPVGVCCCCRKRMKKRSQATGMTTIQSQSIHSPPTPPPDYNNLVDPAGPVPMYTPGYPAPGGSVVHPPPANPLYPSLPQYGGQPAVPPNPGFTPVMYNLPDGSETEGSKGGVNMGELSSAVPLLGPSQNEVGLPPAPYTGMDVLNSNNSTVQFNSSNFL